LSARVSVLVADDHPLFRAALVEAVKARPDLELTGVAADGREALDAIRRIQPDVAVLDLTMPELDGDQVLNAMVRDELTTKALFLAAATDPSVVYDLVAAGAGGYLDKGAPAEQICDAIVSVARGKTVISKDVEAGVLQQIRLRGGSKRGPQLTPRELEVLRLVADGLSAPKLAERLNVEQSTVKSHLQNIYEKLGVSDRAAAVAEGMRQGLVE
jgi:two-component system nitrate/nitrite response regulator NarL